MKIYNFSPVMYVMYDFAFQINLTQIIVDSDLNLIAERL